MSYFNSKNITLRALEPSDLDWLMKVENDETLWEISDTKQPYSKHLLLDYINNSSQDIYAAKQMRLVIEFQEKPIGLIDLFDFDPFHKRAGIGILILKDFQNQGLGNEALKNLINYSFNYLKIHQLFANITDDNTSSLQLFQANGFSINGTKQDWIMSNANYKNELFLQLINPNEK